MADAARPAWVDDELFPFESRLIDIDGHTVHYVDDGSGPTLLLLHGNPTWSFDHRDVIRSPHWRSMVDGRRTSPARGNIRRATPSES